MLRPITLKNQTYDLSEVADICWMDEKLDDSVPLLEATTFVINMVDGNEITVDIQDLDVATRNHALSLLSNPTVANKILIDIDGITYDLLEDVEEIDWDDKESDEDTASYYRADTIYLILRNGNYVGVFKEDLDQETLEYINDFVDPM